MSRVDRELVLLMASAPWIDRQFDLKGVDLLLATAAKLPFLRLVLLWRGVLADELASRVQRLELGERVEIVNRKVEIGDYLKKAHATVLLAKHGGIVKSFPHSLIESLIAGKPILLSRTIAMSDYVNKHRCGVVVRGMDLESLSTAIGILIQDYEELSHNAARIDSAEFAVETMIENYRRIYGM
jgi:glycosyltransferase involved in cell wall biosynthesis